MTMLLTVNAGSATLKLSGWHNDDGALRRAWRIDIDLRHGDAPRVQAFGAAGADVPATAPAGRDAATHLRAVIASLHAKDVLVSRVAHRVVHGGERTDAVVSLDGAVRDELRALARLAPLHQPASLALIDEAVALLPDVPQVACLDTAFHATQPEIARRYALPESFWRHGIRAWGFHGLSYASVLATLRRDAPELADGAIVIAHLGNGASACAIHRGESRGTTMGFSPLDGLVMGTRCGHLDPGVLLHLLREYHMDADALEDLLYRRSGLLGVSGASADVRDLLASGAPAARRALDLFAWRAAREVASLLPALPRLDALVFTGGIGEHAASVRADIVRHLGSVGVTIDEPANAANAAEIGAMASRVRVLVCTSDEESAMASLAADRAAPG